MDLSFDHRSQSVFAFPNKLSVVCGIDNLWEAIYNGKFIVVFTNCLISCLFRVSLFKADWYRDCHFKLSVEGRHVTGS